MCNFLRGVPYKDYETLAAVFPRGSPKWKSNNDDRHSHGQEERKEVESLSSLVNNK